MADWQYLICSASALIPLCLSELVRHYRIVGSDMRDTEGKRQRHHDPVRHISQMHAEIDVQN